MASRLQRERKVRCLRLQSHCRMGAGDLITPALMGAGEHDVECVSQYVWMDPSADVVVVKPSSLPVAADPGSSLPVDAVADANSARGRTPRGKARTTVTP